MTTSSSSWRGCSSATLGFDDSLCNRFEVAADVASRAPRASRSAMAPGRCRSPRWARARGIRLADCAFYTDSFSDAPMLAAVGRPVAVHPDPRLARLARRRGWPCEAWGTAAAPPPALIFLIHCVPFRGFSLPTRLSRRLSGGTEAMNESPASIPATCDDETSFSGFLVLRPVESQDRERLIGLLEPARHAAAGLPAGVDERHPIDWSPRRRSFTATLDERLIGAVELIRDERSGTWELSLALDCPSGVGGARSRAPSTTPSTTSRRGTSGSGCPRTPSPSSASRRASASPAAMASATPSAPRPTSTRSPAIAGPRTTWRPRPTTLVDHGAARGPRALARVASGFRAAARVDAPPACRSPSPHHLACQRL
ncbi:MAG: hypothetical protein R3F43_31795 [bacterium]